MEIIEHITLVEKRGDFSFVLLIPKGASYGAALDASFSFLQHISERAQHAVQESKPTESEGQ